MLCKLVWHVFGVFLHQNMGTACGINHKYCILGPQYKYMGTDLDVSGPTMQMQSKLVLELRTDCL